MKGCFMKIAISSSGSELTSPVDSRFGRAPVFIVYDTENGEHTAESNSLNLSAAQGAGIQTARNVVTTGARAVISGNFGPKAFRVLEESGVKMYRYSSGTVADAVSDFKAGRLPEVQSANVNGHW